jgi:CubicO group peptidase (beta-lactamase class C family)
MRRVALAAALLPGTVPAQQADPVREYIHAQRDWRTIPGLAVGVMRGGRMIRAEGYGLSHRDLPDSVRPSTPFQLGSVGKQFTSAAILMLVQDGRLRLGDSITALIPSAPASWRAITVRHLLTHTSGLGDYDNAIADLSREFSSKQLVELIASEPLAFRPGSGFRYSNSGYVLLGMIVEAAAGMSLADFLSSRIFRPLGMQSTGVAGQAGWPIAGAAQGYRSVKGSPVAAPPVSRSLNSTGDGSVYSTVLDLEKWDHALYGDALITRASKDAMWTPVRTRDGSIRQYGFGWAIGNHRGRRFVAHGGTWQGYSAHIVRYLDDSVTVVVLMNLSGVGDAAGQIAHRVARFHIPSLRAEAWPPAAAVALDTAILDRYTGRYQLNETTIRVWREGTRLMLNATGRGTAQLVPVSPTRFVIEAEPVQFRFGPASSARPELYVREASGEKRATRLRDR